MMLDAFFCITIVTLLVIAVFTKVESILSTSATKKIQQNFGQEGKHISDVNHHRNSSCLRM